MKARGGREGPRGQFRSCHMDRGIDAMKVALVHDWLPVFSGAERVLAQIMSLVGPSDLYTLFDFLTPEERRAIGAKAIYTSSMNQLPFIRKYYRWTFPFCPQAIEGFNVSQYDL